jgi:hypothetical protein
MGKRTIRQSAAAGCKQRLSALYIVRAWHFRLLFAFPHSTALLCPNESPSSSTSSARPVQGLPGQYSQPYTGTTDAANPCSLQRVRSQARLQAIGSFHRHRSAYLEVTGGPPVETNDTPRCLHCLREGHARPPMHPTSRDRTRRTQPRHQVPAL